MQLTEAKTPLSPEPLATPPASTPSRAGSASPLVPGTMLDRFRIVRLVACGGSADVYEAEHVELGRHVALKVLRPDALNQVQARFAREARTSAALRHPHVADVFDVGKTSDERPFLVMELLEGEPLDAWVARGPLPVATVVEIGKQLSSALAFVHTQGIVHCDVKPENTMLRFDRGGLELKLFDFGISKSISPQPSERVTQRGSVAGTPQYMAPEVISGRDPGVASDIYAVGVVLYECLTGNPPHDCADLSAQLVKILCESPAPLRTKRADCPEELAAIVERALSREPEQRFATAQDLFDALSQVPLRITPSSLRAPAPSTWPAPSAEAAAEEEVTPLESSRAERTSTAAPIALSRRRNRHPNTPMVALVVGLSLAVGVAALEGARPPRDGRSSQAVGEGVSTRTVPMPTASTSSSANAPHLPGLDITAPLDDTPRVPSRALLAERGGDRRVRRARSVGSRTGASLANDAVTFQPVEHGPLAPAPSATDRASAQALAHAALSAFARGQLPRAQALYRAAVRRDDGFADAWRGLALVSARMNQPADARRAYARYLVLAPAAPDAHVVRAALADLRGP